MRIMFRAIALFFTCAVISQAKQPNVVVVITDDQGYANLSCMGHPVLQTPHVDTLYEEGVRLTDYHVDPTCAPTRAALMTGRYSDRAGVWHTVLGRHLLRLREKTMAEVFKESGYRTGLFGKWHLGDLYPFRPQERGFDETVIHSAGGVGQGPDYWGNDYFDDTYKVNGEWKRFEGFCTDVFFDEAIKFMKECSEREEPFLTFVSTNAPHGPFYSPDRNFERFRDLEHDGEKIKEVTGRYYGMIENIDDNMGKLVSFLKKEDLYGDTILVYTSDNGPVINQGIRWYNASLRGHKGSNYDGGHLVPFIMTWPNGGIEGGRDVDPVTAHIDILPTLIDLCDLKDQDTQYDGKSIEPLLRGNDSAWEKRSLVVESQRVYDPEKYRVFSVFTDGWRLVGRDELYDFQNDRNQKTDVSAEYPEKLAALRETYEEFWADVSKDHHIASVPMVGASEANPVTLQSHDWTSEGFWNQDHIRFPFDQENNPVGKWVIDVVESGWYQVSVRRWPAEADKAINDAYVGRAVNVDTARLSIQGQSFEKEIAEGSVEVTFRLKLEKGMAELDTVLTSQNGGDPVSPFYAYLLREEGDNTEAWQTREGLGLPLAVWPENHGADTASTR